MELINVDIHSYDFKKLPVIDTTFCFGFLYHSKHPLWILENLSKSTRYLFLTTKIFDEDRPYAYFYDVAECNNDETNWWCFTPRCLNLILKRSGFATVFIERLDPHIGKSHPVNLSLDGRVLLFAESI